MKRRGFLAMVGLGFGGCLLVDNNPSPESVILQSRDVEHESPDVLLSVAYNAGARYTIPTDPPTHAETNHKWLVVRMDVTNKTDEERIVTGYQYVVRAGGETYEYVATDTEWALSGPAGTSGPSAPPGGKATGFVVFHLPDHITQGFLTIRENTRQE